MFGAWQAGAWRAWEAYIKPDLIVGASIGSLNGYAIASGWSAQELCEWWLRPQITGFGNLTRVAQGLVDTRPREKEFAVVIVDAVRMKPRTVSGDHVRAEHLVASCAVPGAVLPQKINGRWYVDGGLLNPLPVWAAVELGADRIFALHCLPQMPSAVLRPAVAAFRAVWGHNPPVPASVRVTTLMPSRRLGTLQDAIRWHEDRIKEWVDLGAADAARCLKEQGL